MKQEHKVTKELVDRMIEIHFPFSGNPYEVTVMEMLDEMQPNIENEGVTYTLFMTKFGCEYRFYSTEGGIIRLIRVTKDTLPNALAEMVLWLHENNYISFKK